MDSLNDFFAIIGNGKAKVEKEKKDIIGDMKLEDLFASLETEKKKTKRDKEKLKKEVAAFESFLFAPKKISEEDNTIKAVKVLETELSNLKNTSYKSIDRLMKGICSEYNITPLQLHNGFKEKHGVIPDEWIKQQKEDVDTTNWRDDYKPIEIETEDIIKPEPLKPEEDEVEISENIERSRQILDKLIPEEEKIEEGPDEEIRRLKREMDQLRKMVYESVRTATAQGGGGEVRLEFLDDVDRDSVKVDGKFLKYQSSTGKWIGADASGGVSDLGPLSGIATMDTSTINDGDTIIYDSSTQQFITTSTVGGSATSINGIAITSSLPMDNGVLTFDGTTNQFVFETPFTIVDLSDNVEDGQIDYGSFT